MKLISAFLCGFTFAVGLGLSGMTRPEKVVGFLDFAGNWDPSLAFVLGGAIVVSASAFPFILKRRLSLCGDSFALPTQTRVDVSLLAGAAIFGIGWGLSGYCPGPALVSLVTLAPPVVTFVLFMAAGFHVAQWIEPRSSSQPLPIRERSVP